MIGIHNLTRDRINKDFLKKITKNVLKEEKFRKSVELSIVLIKPLEIKKLNRLYRKENLVTDVLAFGRKLSSKNLKFPVLPNKYTDLGEIVICLDKVKENAREFDSSFKKELTQVLIHGILHLLGYDHEKSEKEKEKMRKKEKYYLKLLYH